MNDDLAYKLETVFKAKRFGSSGEYDPDFDLLDVAAQEIKELRNQLILARAQAEGAGSLLLDVQQDSIAARKALTGLREYFAQKRDQARRESGGNPNTEADCWDHANDMVATYISELRQ